MLSSSFPMAPTPVIPNTQQKQPKGGKGYFGPQFQRVLSVSLGKAYGGDVYSERELFILATETEKRKEQRTCKDVPPEPTSFC